MAKPYLSVIVPASSDVRRVVLDLVEIDHLLSEQDFSSEITVVFDESDEKTREVVSRLSVAIKRLRTIENAGEIGVGVAIKIGILASAGQWRIPVTHPSILAAFITALPSIPVEKGFGVIVGNQRMPSSVLRRLTPGYLTASFWNWTTRFVLRLRSPVVCPLFLAFSADEAVRIATLVLMPSERCFTELLMLTERSGARVGRVIVQGFSSGHAPVPHLQTLIGAARMRWWLSRGRYQSTEGVAL